AWVLYSSGCRERMTIRMADSRPGTGRAFHDGPRAATIVAARSAEGRCVAARRGRGTRELGWNQLPSLSLRKRSGDVNEEVAGQGAPAEDHREPHPGAVGDGKADQLR